MTIKPVRAGRLRHPVTIERRMESNTDGYVSEQWVDALNVMADVTPVSAREFLSNDQLQAQITHRIHLRWFDGLSPKDRIRYGSRIFEIVQAINVEERNRKWDVLAIEVL